MIRLRMLSTMVLATAAVALHGCGRHEVPSGARIAFVTISPQRYMVARIAGERFEVHTLVGSGQSPHSYTPTPAQIARLAEAQLFFRIGVEAEEGIIPRIRGAMPNVNIIDMRAGIALRDMTEPHDDDDHGHHHDVDHDHDCDHSHYGKDPHVWLAPNLVSVMAATIAEALCAVDPKGAPVYHTNLETFRADLDSLDRFLQITLEPLRGQTLLVFHPAFGYLADRYGLIQRAVETGGKEPSARALARLIDEARAISPAAIFVQSQYAQKSAEVLARQIGCAVVPINPLPDDYCTEMRELGKAIAHGLRGQ